MHEIVKIAVVGDGFGGLMATLVLKKLGFEVHLFLSDPEMLPNRPMVLHDNALRALKAIGLDPSALKSQTLAGLSLEILGQQGIASLSFDETSPWMPSISLKSQDLQAYMLLAARELGVNIHSGVQVQSAWVEDERVMLSLGSGDNHSFSAIILDDGPSSKLRASMGLQGKVEPAGGDWVWGTAPRACGQNNVQEIIAPNHTRFVTFPLNDGEVAFFFTVPMGSWPQIRDHRIEEFIETWQPFGEEVMGCLKSVSDWSLLGTQTNMMAELPSWFKPPAFVLGEGAHSIQLFTGWGESASLVDALVLAQLMARGVRIKVGMEDIGQTWENIRRPFVVQAQGLSRQLLALADLTSAPARLLRDALLPFAQRAGLIEERFERLVVGHYPLESSYFHPIEAEE